MKKRLTLALIACLTITAMVLAGCSGGGSGSASSDEGIKVTPDVNQFVLDVWNVEITDARVLFDEGTGYDNLVIYTKATNDLDKELKFQPNLVTMQKGELMSAGNIADADGKILITSNDDMPFCKKGESCERVFAYKIEDYDTPIESNFGGYTVAVEDTLVTFDVSGKQTEEAKKAADERQAELEKQKAISSVDLDEATVTVPKGWMVESSTSVSCTLSPDKGSARVSVSVQGRSAKEACKGRQSNYSDNPPVDKVTIKGVTWLRLKESDTNISLFADASDGKAVCMSVINGTYKEALPVFKSVKLK